ncbi:hypothetical protein EGW08_010247 [Elysia chlorotica]|uniref:Uncharacterized protein n=1 Tax=Elysia chlorotica TaxID=188477 RepID=A0A433TK92_ELYCH|nr:hypothetical protein EGW08_010247 [Elysia chlorotica]
MASESLDIIGNSGEDLNPGSMEDDWELYWNIPFPNDSDIISAGANFIANVSPGHFNINTNNNNNNNNNNNDNGNASSNSIHSYTQGDSRIPNDREGYHLGALRSIGLSFQSATETMLMNLRQNATVCANYSASGCITNVGPGSGTRGDLDIDLDLDEEGEGHLWRDIPLGVILALLCLLTTAGNIMVLHAVRTEKRLQTIACDILEGCLDILSIRRTY